MNWVNRTLLRGDNLEFLKAMDRERVDLIYADPPFFSQRDYGKFSDTWPSLEAYLDFMRPRLGEMRRVLKPTGSVYLHCDPTASHYLKVMMDAVFGRERFQNEFIWYYGGGGASKSRWGRKHDVVLFYSVSDKWTFNSDAVREPHKWTRGQVRADGSKRSSKGKLADDVWQHHSLMPWANERTGYPTQKPLALLERIIKASSNRDNLILDPFCGCATACVAAERLNRRWAGIDISPLAVKLVNDRIESDRAATKEAEVIGFSLWGGVTALETPPVRTDLGKLPNYRTHRHRLYGEQEGVCAGCATHFPFRVMDVDHILPRSRGGTDHPDNLQLLCSGCNRSKGGKTMAEWRASQ